jgi:hypothetical protein
LCNAEADSGGYLGHLQFSIGQALLWMTALAVFMAATHYLKETFAARFMWQDNCLYALWSAFALAAMWLVCGKKWWFSRWLPVLVGMGFEIAWVCWVALSKPLPLGPSSAIIPLISPGKRAIWCACLLGCEAVVTTASLLVVRLAGYRLIWHWSLRRPKSQMEGENGPRSSSNA